MIITPPFEFALPPRNIAVTAEFEALTDNAYVESGKRALLRDDYDSAANAFDTAYSKNSANPEAVFYSTLSRLASIAVNTKVRQLASSVGVGNYPGNLNNLLGTGDAWANSYNQNTGQTEQRPGWRNTYNGVKLWQFATPRGHFAIPNQTFIWTETQNNGTPTLATFYIMTFLNVMGTNLGSWNGAVDDALEYAFGDAFEAAAARTAELPYDAGIVLDQTIVEKLLLQDYLRGGDKVGRAELDILFSILRVFKSGLEWVAAYDLETDRTPFRLVEQVPDYGAVDGLIDMINLPYVSEGTKIIGDFTTNTDALNNVLKYFIQKLDEKFTLNHNAQGISGMLPLRNNFLLERRGAQTTLDKSKADLLKSIDTFIAVCEHYYNSNPANLPQKIQDALPRFRWIRGGLTQLKAAVQTGGVFYFPASLPTSGDAWNYTSGNARYGINTGKLFTPGALALNKLIVTENGGRIPKFFGWGTNTATSGTYITRLNDFKERNYTWVGSQLNIKALKEVFVQGLEKNGVPLNDTEYMHTLFPDILLNRENAEMIYKFYYDLYDYSNNYSNTYTK
jgi:hypothetical protein